MREDLLLPNSGQCPTEGSVLLEKAMCRRQKAKHHGRGACHP